MRTNTSILHLHVRVLQVNNISFCRVLIKLFVLGLCVQLIENNLTQAFAAHGNVCIVVSLRFLCPLVSSVILSSFPLSQSGVPQRVVMT